MTPLHDAGKPTDVSSRGGTFWQRAADRPLCTVFLLALIVRVLNLALLEGHSAFFAEDDTIVYWKLGAKLATPDEFWPALLSTTDRMPLYPLLLAGVRSMFGDAPRIVAAVQAVIATATCALIAALGAALSPRVGLIAGILAALSVTLVVYSTQILTDSLFLFFFTLMLYAGTRFLLRPTPALAAAAGLAGGLALATRPAIGLLLAAAVPVVFLIAWVKRKSFVSAGAATLLFAITAAAPIAPVLLRNAIRYASAALTSQTGDYLAFWIVPLVAERTDGTPYRVSVDRMDALYREALARRDASALSNPFVQSAVKAELAREEMARLPARAVVAAWLEGAVVNLGAPAVLADPRVRVLPKPSFYNTPGVGLWQKARAYLLDDPGRYQLLLVAGLVGMVPFLALEAVGFSADRRTGGDRQIPPADGAGAGRARRHPARAPAGAEALAHVPEKWEPVFR